MHDKCAEATHLLMVLMHMHAESQRNFPLIDQMHAQIT